ncbi:MAG TPA: glycosyltransferase family 39 protein [Anaerolineae bacterium]|nr:glycosyltransferase family 39 protein [Anaerolineae bacterium]
MPSSLRRLRTAFLADGRVTTRIALLAFAALALFYAWRLIGFLVNDDEGSYLYAAWRISRGELPYRDFLTPQLPGFLLPGGWLMRWVGPQVWPLRAMAAVSTLLAGVFTWKTARRLFGPAVAAGAAGLFLLQPMSYLFGRIFRSEPFMLLWCAVGVYAFVRAYPSLAKDVDPDDADAAVEAGRPAWLLAAGLAFGLAILCKLFGVLPLAGCLLWLLIDGRQRRRPWRRMLGECLTVGLAATVVVGAVMVAFAQISPNLEEAVLEHHLMQHSAQTRWGAFVKTLWFYYEFVDVDQGGLLLAAALAMGLAAWHTRDRRHLLFGCQVATMLGFLLLGRDLFTRHVMVLMPAMATLGCAWALGLRREAAALAPDSAIGQAARVFPVLAALVFVLPWLSRDVSEGSRLETATPKLADLIRLSTQPQDLVFGDFSELNFYSQRPTTYSAASMSAGAAKSGQISWARVQGELAGRKPALMVEVDLATDPGHLVHMLDYADYIAWREAEYTLVGPFHRDFQAYALYAPKDHPLPILGNFAQGPKLLGAEPLVAAANAGDSIQVATAWQGPAVPDAEYVATVRLVDLAGQEWAQSDTSLFADDPDDDRKSFAWEPGELVGQRIPLTLPADLPPGRYRVELGSYIRDAEAMKLLDAAGNPYEGRALAGEITVRAGRLKEIPEGAGVAERFDGQVADIGGGRRLTLLGRGALPAEAVAAGTSFPLELWWRADSDRTGWGMVLRQRFDLGDDKSTRHADADHAFGLSSETKLPVVWRQRLRVAVPRGIGGSATPLRLVITSGDRDVGRFDVGTIAVEPPPADAERPATAAPVMEADSAAGKRLVFADPPSSVPANSYPGPQPSPPGWTEPPRHPAGSLPRVGDLAQVEAAWLEPAAPAAGDLLRVVLRLSARVASPVPYWSSIQVLDGQQLPVAQHDGPLGGWQRGSDRWEAGERITDLHEIALPADLPPGSYTLAAAVYNPQSGWRLPVRGPGAMGDMLRLGELRVAR